MNGLKLSPQLIQELHSALVAKDQQAQNLDVTCQYFAAIIGYLVGKQGVPETDKQEFLQELFAFAEQVMRDSATPPAPRYQPQDAWGVWKPGDP